MFEKVNAGHPDKMADRLAGAVVDLVYERAGGLTKANPRVACEVMAGHGRVDVQIETSLGRLDLRADDVDPLIHRLFGERVEGNVLIVPQDPILAHNQDNGMRVADNGIFRGVPPTHEQKLLTAIAASIYDRHPFDGKYIIGDAYYKPDFHATMTIPARTGHFKTSPKHLTICQSHAKREEIYRLLADFERKYTSDTEIKATVLINPLGEWTGGPNTDSGATNRKLGSDMGDGVTGGGLHGKDLSKADVSVNIWCYLESIRTGHEVTASCSIGDETVNGIPYKDIVEQARLYIHTIGGFEKFAEWGLVRPLAQV